MISLSCDQLITSSLSYDGFLKLLFDGDTTNVPEHFEYWLEQTADANKDKSISAEEANHVVCEMSRATQKYLKITPSPHVVGDDGDLRLTAYEANDKEVSLTEFQTYFGAKSTDYVLATLSPYLDSELLKKFEAVLNSGIFTVSQKNKNEHIDILSVDSDNETRLLKLLALAYSVSELNEKTTDKIRSTMIPSLVQLFVEQKNWPWLVAVGTPSVTFAINTAQGSSLGPEGAKNYYILEGTSISISLVGKPISWGQPSNQSRHILRDPSLYTPTPTPFLKKLEALLERVAQDLKQSQYFVKNNIDMTSPESLKILSQTLVNTVLDYNLASTPISVQVASDIQLSGVTAHFSPKDRVITFDYNYFKSVRAITTDAEFQRYFIAVLAQEIIHGLQHDTPAAYDENIRYYNSGPVAYQLMGKVGGRWYNDQPLEKDAHQLAAKFVETLNIR